MYIHEKISHEEEKKKSFNLTMRGFVLYRGDYETAQNPSKEGKS